MNPLFTKILHLSQLPQAAIVRSGGVYCRGPVEPRPDGNIEVDYFIFAPEEVLSIHLEPDLITIEIK